MAAGYRGVDGKLYEGGVMFQPSLARTASKRSATHDALQTTFASKFQLGLWRPVTAIRRADEDGNSNTTADTEWTSLVANPPYPSYAGNMAGIGTSQSTILALFFGCDDIPFQTHGKV